MTLLKTICLAVSLCLASALTAFSQDAGPILEVVVYSIKQSSINEYERLLKTFRQEVQSYHGFGNYQTLKQTNSSYHYIDMVNWSDITTALSAANRVQSSQNCKNFLEAIDSVYTYGEFELIQSNNNKHNSNMKNNVKEVVIYQIRDEQVPKFEELSQLADNFLTKRNGFISRNIYKDHKTKGVYMDIVEWASLEDAESASAATQQELELMPFFEATEKVISFSHYEKI